MTKFPKIKRDFYCSCLEFICDKGYKPYIKVFTGHPKYLGPREFESSQQITVFNVSTQALTSYKTDKEGVFFTCKFRGVSTNVFVPWQALCGIYANEEPSITQDFAFQVEEEPTKNKKRPNIKLIHSNNNNFKSHDGVKSPLPNPRTLAKDNEHGEV